MSMGASSAGSAAGGPRKFYATGIESLAVDIDSIARLEAAVAAEVALSTLAVINLLIHDFGDMLSSDGGHSSGNNHVTWKLIDLLKALLTQGLSVDIVPAFFQTLLLFVRTCKTVFFDPSES